MPDRVPFFGSHAIVPISSCK